MPTHKPYISSREAAEATTGDSSVASKLGLLDYWLENNSVIKSDEVIVIPKTAGVDNDVDLQVAWYDNPLLDSPDKSGCERLSFHLPTGTHEVHFITEWSLFFNMMAEKERVDYLKREVPILQLAWFFFYHKYVIRATKVLIIYLIISELIAFTMWKGYTLGNTAAFVAGYAAVHVSCAVIKGSGDALTVTSVHESKKHQRKRFDPRDAISVDSNEESLFGSFVQLCKGSYQLANQLSTYLKQGRKISKSGAVKVSSFYDLMEAGTEYLVTLRSESSMSNTTKSFKPKHVTSFMFVFIMLFSTISGLLFTFVTIGQAAMCSGKAFNNTDNYCSRTVFFTIFELGGVIRFVGSMLMFGNIGAGFAALLYGADVANALTRHWLTRFGPFRTIKIEKGDEDEEKVEKKKDSELKVKKEVDFNENVDNNEKNKYYEQMEEKEEDTVEGIEKSKCEQKTEKEEECKEEFAVDQVKISDFQSLICRDAFERYLFINYYMSSASTIWSTYLVLMVTTNLALFLYVYFLIIWEISNYGAPSFTSILNCVVNFCMTLFVMGCVSYANSAVEKIRNSFIYSAVDDYSIFDTDDEKGRRVWIDYVAEAPVYWYIFGFALTRQWLAAFVGGGISSIAAAALLMIMGLGG
mmetsp:Transcript_3185/g.5649  ORF Transcript_3185/g.5649 Transcript_3185/m.5649 type:complete len:637 (+) Transcript_3185:94-2004(+)